MIDFHKLKIWLRSVALSVAVAKATRNRSRYAPSGLIRQLNEALNSIHANIAEGCGLNTPQQTARHLDICIGSINEAESHLIQAKALGVLPGNDADAYIREICELRPMTLNFKNWVLRNER